LGLIIALTAWLFLNTLNPKLVNLNLNLGQIITNNSDTVVGTSGGGGGSGDVNTTPSGPVIDVCNNDTKIPSAYTVANEGFRNKPYIDSRGFLTVGVGHKLSGPNDPLNRELSDQEIKDLYAQDYSKHANEARASASRHGVNFDSLSPNRQAVLVDMAFNMGAAQGGGLDDFKLMWEGIKNNNYNQASAEILSSEYAGQVPGRARGNADIMKTDSSDPMHRQIQSDPQAASFCV
ncbi:glycoside hydrolase family protein, partial [Candidatus Uhrbacteria bacterium]|nr:glycoside hydrolase family protein [Candidatus Uhrbacteria bacterium]